MRFPDLLVQVLTLEERIKNYEKDLSYLHAQVTEIRRNLNRVRTNPDPTLAEGDDK